VARKQQKLVLSEYEQSLIKGLTVHTDLNDQMIVAIFSHLSRTINHREIGYFRDQSNTKYSAVASASKETVDAFLARYERFERLAQVYEIVPREAHFQLVQKASEAMKAAVGIFNNPTMSWKSEIFIVNAVIAWTYLMHAYYMTKGIDYRYVKDGAALKTEAGRDKHWELSKCLKVAACPLPTPVKANLQYLIEVRNEIEHRLSDNVDQYLESKLQACALNFDFWLCEWYGEACSIAHELAFAIQFADISFRSQASSQKSSGMPSVIESVNALIEDAMTPENYNDPRYSYRVYIVPRTVNNPKKADQAVVFAGPGSKIEMAVRETERPKYTATEIVQSMRDEGFADFTVHGKNGFVSIWKSMDAKKPGKGFGVEVAGRWLWYERMIGEVRVELRKQTAQIGTDNA